MDSLTNISIGGLLSEASLMSGFDPKSFGSNAATQPSQIVSDSLDAFIFARTSRPPVSRPPAEVLRTSILDAEETCHAFPLRKLSSSADVQTASGKGFSVGCSQDVPSNLLKLLNADKVSCFTFNQKLLFKFERLVWLVPMMQKLPNSSCKMAHKLFTGFF